MEAWEGRLGRSFPRTNPQERKKIMVDGPSSYHDLYPETGQNTAPSSRPLGIDYIVTNGRTPGAEFSTCAGCTRPVGYATRWCLHVGQRPSIPSWPFHHNRRNHIRPRREAGIVASSGGRVDGNRDLAIAPDSSRPKRCRSRGDGAHSSRAPCRRPARHRPGRNSRR